MVELVVLGLAGVVGTAWLTRVLARVSWRPVDRPNPRSLHVTPTPRVGGLAIFISVAASLAAVAAVDHSSTLGVVAPLLVSTGIVFMCSAWEDFRGLPPAVRLGIHGGAASLYLWWSGAYDISVLPWMPVWLSVAGVGFLIVWMANLYNFMDGADGLAGGMAIIGLAVIGIEAAIAGVISVSIVAFLASAAAAGFLTVNFPPARAFLGDAGSVSLGFLAAGAAVHLARSGVPIFQPVLAFAPFVLDATYTLLRRVLSGEAFWRPHREHWYQRLIRRGWSHRRTTLLYYGLMVLSGTASILYCAGPAAAVLTVVFAHAVLPVATRLAEHRALPSPGL